MPPPALHRFFSASATQENGEVMRSPLRVSGGFTGGEQVALVKTSTSQRTMILGKVPPRLENLFFKGRGGLVLSSLMGMMFDGSNQNLRCK